MAEQSNEKMFVEDAAVAPETVPGPIALEPIAPKKTAEEEQKEIG